MLLIKFTDIFHRLKYLSDSVTLGWNGLLGTNDLAYRAYV